MGLIDRILRRANQDLAGEMSALRVQSIGNAFGEYRLKTSKVNYELARQLYRNEHNDYKLGAWAAKPVVNTAAGFMGTPRFQHKGGDEEVQAVLDQAGAFTSRWLEANRNGSRDGDVWLRLDLVPNRFDREDIDFDMKLVPPEWVLPPVYDPLTGEIRELVIKYPVPVATRQGARIVDQGQFTIVEVLTPTSRTLEVDGYAPQEVRQVIEERAREEAGDNDWGFIPLVHVKNDAERQALHGMSDLEPIEPFMRAYHDTFLFAIQGAKTVARPKVQFALADVKDFLEKNFTAAEIASGKLRFHDKELFLMQRDGGGSGHDTADFIVADTGLAGVSTLLELLFYCIVDVSETPEFAFGTAVASSKASVSEQMPVLGRNIRRRRGEREDPYGETASMYLAMQAQVGAFAKPSTYRVDVDWDEVSPKDDSEVASTVEQMIAAMVIGVDAGLISQDAATDFLAEYVPTMLPYVTDDATDDERTRLIATAAFRQRIKNGDFDDNAPPPPMPDDVPRIGAGAGG